MISLTRSRVAASNPSRGDSGAFSFNDFSGEYAFYFSTGIGTEPDHFLRHQSAFCATILVSDELTGLVRLLARSEIPSQFFRLYQIVFE
jgi:hypothetical protein